MVDIAIEPRKPGPAEYETRLNTGLPSARARRAMFLVAPLVLYLMLNFFAPLAGLLVQSVQDPELPAALPRTSQLLREWNGEGLPPLTVVSSLAEELSAAVGSAPLAVAATRLNRDINGFRSLLLATARKMANGQRPFAMDDFIAADDRWADREIWSALRNAAGPYTSFYIVAALDRRIDADGRITRVSRDHAIFIDVFIRTFWIAGVVTAITFAMGYPLAYMLTVIPRRASNLLMIFVLLPFWTSVLVRTTAWVVILQREGVVNSLLQWAYVTSDPVQLVYNRMGVFVAMTHVLLPFMVLPLYAVMRSVPPSTTRAALSLGAKPMIAFARVFVPQTIPGIIAGCLLVFIQAIGFYITPALVGGASDQMLSYFIAFYTNQTLNWGMASALAVILLVVTAVFYALYTRVGVVLTRFR